MYEGTTSMHLKKSYIKTTLSINCKFLIEKPRRHVWANSCVREAAPMYINRGHPCHGSAAIFAGMLYNVQVIHKSSTQNIMHVSIIVLELPAKLQWVID